MASVKITLKEEFRWEAIDMRKLRGIETPADFEGPKFEDVLEFGVEDGFACVSLEDVKYCYPVNSIARIAIYK